MKRADYQCIGKGTPHKQNITKFNIKEITLKILKATLFPAFPFTPHTATSYNPS